MPLSSPSFPSKLHWMNRRNLVSCLEFVQDLIVICLCIGLFSFMVFQLRDMFMSLLPPLELAAVTADIPISPNIGRVISLADYLLR